MGKNTDSIRVNTSKVLSAANSINTINGNIDDEYEMLVSQINGLSSSWHSNAGRDVINKFTKITKKHKKNRHNVILDYTRFLKKQVKAGYEDTEKAIISAESAFL